MAFEPKDMSGSLFRNSRKELDTHPDYNGSARIEGTDYWVNAWLRETKDGGKYMSLSFKRKDGTAARPIEPKILSMTAQAPAPRRDLDDEVPF